MNIKDYKYIVVGSGFYGAVIAERIANDLNEKVLVIEKRNHIGGNCYSKIDTETGIEYHKYGPHIFHTSNQEVMNYITKFTPLNNYIHQILSSVKDRLYQLPINLETINSYYNKNLKPYEVLDFLYKEIQKEQITSPNNFEEKAISLVGKPLYEAFIKGYTQKQWGINPTELPAFIIQRLPFRSNYNENYYFDKHQGIPEIGYGKLFEKMLSNPNIDLLLNTDFFSLKEQITQNTLLIYSGAIDRFFDYKFGKLSYRTIKFEKEILNYEEYQGVCQINYPELEIPYTRIVEHRYFHPERQYTKDKTLIFREYSELDNGENPFYPININENNKIADLYKDESQKLSNVIIGGRLGDFKYYDMHHVIANALEIYKTKIRNHEKC